MTGIPSDLAEKPFCPEVFAWGGNARGQVGDGTTVDKRTPVEVISHKLDKGVRFPFVTTQICAGDDFTVRTFSKWGTPSTSRPDGHEAAV